LSKLRNLLRSKRTLILVLVFFFVFSLRVTNWFQYPFILISGDSRPPLIQEAFLKRVAYTWDETDFGLPSVYAPRILVPSYFFTSIFRALGASLYTAQMSALFLISFISSALMFLLMKKFTNNDLVASFVAALYTTSNLYLINDREVTAIAFFDTAIAILPCLLLFIEAITKRSYKLMAFSGMLFTLTYSVFPNFRVVLICIVALILVSLFMFIKNAFRIGYRRENTSKLLGVSINVNSLYTFAKYLSVFIVALLSASIWIIALVWSNFTSLIQTYQQTAAVQFVLYIRPIDVLRLISKWGFYSGEAGRPYIPYADAYLHNPWIITLSYLPPILAFATILTTKSRRVTVYFSAMAAVFLALSSGFSPYLSQLYLGLATYIPFMIAFRESAQWSFFVIICYAVLIGSLFSTLCSRLKQKKWQLLTIGLVAAIMIASAYPLATGDVSRNWLNTNIKGSSFPNSYTQLNQALPNEYWTLLLPERYTYVVYNFSGVPLNSGNPYPLIFSKPIISGTGTEYLQNQNPDLPLGKLYQAVGAEMPGTPKLLGMLGIKDLILEKDLVSGALQIINESQLEGSYIKIKEWDEVALFENNFALPKLYAADNFLNYTDFDNMYAIIQSMDWSTLDHSAFISSTSMIRVTESTPAAPEYFTWKELSPTSYEAQAYSTGTFTLVFLETYDPNWKLTVNGHAVSEADHLKTNAFANGWLLKSTGNLTIEIEYEPQKTFTAAILASIFLPALLTLFLFRSRIQTLAQSISRRIKRGSAANRFS
jgi:hypothetical protein